MLFRSAILSAVVIPDIEESQWSAFKYGLKMASQEYGVNKMCIRDRGYTDPNYFSYVFKRQYGVSPSCLLYTSAKMYINIAKKRDLTMH